MDENNNTENQDHADQETSQNPNVYLEPSPATVDPQPSPAMPEKPKRIKLFVLVGLAVIVVGVGVGAWLMASAPDQPNKEVSNSASRTEATGTPLIGKAVQNNYRIYRSQPADKSAKTVTYTLVDENGKVVRKTQGSADLDLITPVGKDSFLFFDNDTSKILDKNSGMLYELLDKNGFRQLNNLPISMEDNSSSSQGRPIGLTSFGDTAVAYQYCKSLSMIKPGEDPYQCDLRSVDLLSGKEQVMALPAELKEYNAKLMAFSGDKQSAYFLGVSKSDETAFQNRAEAITGGGIHFEDDPEVQGIYQLKLTQTVLKLDLASQKVVSTKPIKTEYTYYQKFWLSPNGENLVYSNGGESGELHYVNVPTGKTDTIKLPAADQASEPWSGETTTYDPLFSPNGSLMAYVTYSSKDGKLLESVGVINFKTKTAKEYMRQPPENYKSYPAKGFFGNMRWIDNRQFEMTAGQENYLLNVGKGMQKISTANGLLVGIADGYR